MSVSGSDFNRDYSFDLIESEPTFENKSNTMPSPTGTPWDVHSMPWSSGSSNSQIMEFNASPWKNTSRNCAYRASSKRKSDGESFVPRKQLITDEKMAAHFNSLHISPSLIAESDQTTVTVCEPLETMDDDITMEMDTETKLKTAQKLILSDEVKNISTEPLLPASILHRLEKPCKAIVLWQPPSKISLMPTENQSNKEKESPKKKLSETDLLSMPSTSGINTRTRAALAFMEDEQQNNNNSFEMDLNSMSYDMDI